MPAQRPALVSFNRGEVSKTALARVDVERLRMSAETQENYMPTVLGPMMLRPGTQYIGATNSNSATHILPFVFGTTDTALIELTDGVLRVWNVIDDVETLVTRPAVTSVVTNGDFSSGTGWTLVTGGSGDSATISSGLLTLASPVIGGVARCKRSVTINEVGTEHAFRIIVTRGPVDFYVGSADALDDIIAQTTLETGVHSIACTPAVVTVYIAFETHSATSKIVDSVTFESSGAMTVTTPWTTSYLPLLRFDQSGDVIFVASEGLAPRRIERRSTRSWSVVLYKNNDGPFGSVNTTDIVLSPSVREGNGTLTASRGMFKSTHVGALVRLEMSNQGRLGLLATNLAFTKAIRVTGVGSLRTFSYVLSGTWTGTVRLQRSFTDETTGFANVDSKTSNGTYSHLDSLDNVIAWYRVGFGASDYGSGTVQVDLYFDGGGGSGVCRITSFASSTLVNMEVTKTLTSITPTTTWFMGDWSDDEGWPSAVSFHDGRLWWAGRDKLWGSISDDYSSFDVEQEGDAAAINRSVGFGPIDTVNWLLSLIRLVVGRAGAETSIRSGNLDEPLTPTNFTLKDCSTQGSYPIAPAKLDTRGVFVQRSNRRVYELRYVVEAQDYVAVDMTRLNHDIGVPGFSRIAVQRQPDTTLYFVRADGQVAAFLYEPQDEVQAWWPIVSADSGIIEDVVVLPGTLEDKVYFVVQRTVNNSTVRYIERLARRDQCSGLPEARLSDSHIYYSGSAVTTITGLSHLEGKSVVVWGWNTSTPFTVTLPDGTTETVGKDLGTFTVTSGQITGLGSAVTDAIVGLSYSATFKSAKLAYAAAMGSALNRRKQVSQLGVVLHNTHVQGLRYGQSLDRMDDLPLTEGSFSLDTNTVWGDFDGQMFALSGDWGADERLILQSASPRPCEVMAAVLDVTTSG